GNAAHDTEGYDESCEEDAGKSIPSNVVHGAFTQKATAKKDMVYVQFREGLKQTAFVEGQEVYECTGGTSSKNVVFPAPHLGASSATLAQLAEVASFDLKTIIVVGIGMRGGSLKGKVPDAVVEARGDLVVYPVKTRNGTYYVVSVGPKVSPGSRGAPAAQVARGKPTAQKPAPQGELAAAPSKRSAAQRQKTPAISSLRQRQTQPAESARGAARRGASSKSPIEALCRFPIAFGAWFARPLTSELGVTPVQVSCMSLRAGACAPAAGASLRRARARLWLLARRATTASSPTPTPPPTGSNAQQTTGTRSLNTISVSCTSRASACRCRTTSPCGAGWTPLFC
ncbi:hypothetical protein M885DRAFT_505059, partial [Pelagophyceae sp. CCMP2097]